MRDLEEGEIEITPAMIEAGVAEFLAYDSDYERPCDGAREVFLAMWGAMKADPKT
jgi:hypothetical protein